MRPPATIPARVTFVPLEDLDIEQAAGFGPNSAYVELCLLPVIGPSCCLLYRRVAPLIRVADHVEVDLSQLGRNLGLGAKIGPNSTVVKALSRLEVFHLGAWRPPDRYALRRAVAPLNDRQAQRLPEPARTIHYRSVPRTTESAIPAETCALESGPRR